MKPLYNWKPVLGTKLLGFSIGRGSGALKGLKKIAVFLEGDYHRSVLGKSHGTPLLLVACVHLETAPVFLGTNCSRELIVVGLIIAAMVKGFPAEFSFPNSKQP